MIVEKNDFDLEAQIKRCEEDLVQPQKRLLQNLLMSFAEGFEYLNSNTREGVLRTVSKYREELKGRCPVNMFYQGLDNYLAKSKMALGYNGGEAARVRKGAGYSQDRLVAELKKKDCIIKQSRLSDWERGKSFPVSNVPGLIRYIDWLEEHKYSEDLTPLKKLIKSDVKKK